jgi:hypothetical protein
MMGVGKVPRLIARYSVERLSPVRWRTCLLRKIHVGVETLVVFVCIYILSDQKKKLPLTCIVMGANHHLPDYRRSG